MATASDEQLRFVLVTPETTLLDESVWGLRFPLYDGQIGILPGRAPLLGRLGYGELKITTNQGERFYYVDGGFVQVKDSVVTLLTDRSLPAEKIDPANAEQQLQEASQTVPTSELALATKQRNQERARRMLALAKKQG